MFYDKYVIDDLMRVRGGSTHMKCHLLAFGISNNLSKWSSETK